jgi:alpha-galactosidase
MRIVYDEASQSWELTWPATRMYLRLVDGLLCSTLAGLKHGDEHHSPISAFRDPILATRTEAAVQLAPDYRDAIWRLQEWSQPDMETFLLVLRATDLPLQIELRLVADEATGLLHHYALLRHVGQDSTLDIRHATSASVLVPDDVQHVVHLAGRGGAEAQVQQVDLTYNPLLLESRSGKTGFEFSPYVALGSPEYTYVYELLWSGNWQIHVRRVMDGRVSVSGGLNSWSLRHRLHPGDTLELPSAVFACVPGDLNAATQRLHDYRRRHLLADPDRAIPVQFNSWYPYPGEPPVAKMKAFVDAAAELGCEVFVQDAGWYTTETEDPQESWWMRAGDWKVNPRLFPHGLEELSRHCQERGLGFGIWFEPEAVSPSAVLRREHPEWLHVIGGRPTPSHERAMLHLGVPEARAFVRDRILRVLRATDASWMKWDFNTNLLQGGWAMGLPEELTRQDPLIAHYSGLYRLQDELRAALPRLTLEMCAGGGQRFDAAILSHAHTNWMSDHTQSLVKLAIHFGSQLAHPAIECNDWLIDWPPQYTSHTARTQDERGDIAFRTRVAMLGSFGISAPVERWSVKDIATVKQHIRWYKELVRPLVQTGNQYQLTKAPPLDGEGEWAAIWYAATNAHRGVLFAFRLASPNSQHRFSLPGLCPDAEYCLRTPEGWSSTRLGSDLAAGLLVTVEAPFRSVLMFVERLNDGSA